MSGALIVTAELRGDDAAWADALRRRHYPADRNQLPAHLTMFHALPPSAEREVRTRLGEVTAGRAPGAVMAGLLNLGRGVALRIVSADLEAMRDELAASWHGLLGPQDRQGWRPHITIQNKVEPDIARRLRLSLESSIEPRPLHITGIGLHRYLGGPWDKLRVYAFRGA